MVRPLKLVNRLNKFVVPYIMCVGFSYFQTKGGNRILNSYPFQGKIGGSVSISLGYVKVNILKIKIIEQSHYFSDSRPRVNLLFYTVLSQG